MIITFINVKQGCATQIWWWAKIVLFGSRRANVYKFLLILRVFLINKKAWWQNFGFCCRIRSFSGPHLVRWPMLCTPDLKKRGQQQKHISIIISMEIVDVTQRHQEEHRNKGRNRIVNNNMNNRFRFNNMEISIYINRDTYLNDSIIADKDSLLVYVDRGSVNFNKGDRASVNVFKLQKKIFLLRSNW